MNRLCHAISGVLIAVSVAACVGPQGRLGALEPCGASGSQGSMCSCCQGRTDGVFPSGGRVPHKLLFDGEHLWDANGRNGELAGILAKVRVRDGRVLDTYPSGNPDPGSIPQVMAFDGVNVWVGNLGGKPVARIRANDGALDSYSPLLSTPELVSAFDGQPGTPLALAYDGASIWVAFYVNPTKPNVVVKLRTSDGAVLKTYSINGGAPAAMTFDGTYVWVAHTRTHTILADGQLTKIHKSDGSVMGPYSSGGRTPAALTFDRANIWVAHRDIPPPPYNDMNTYFHTISKIRASDGTFLGLSPSGGYRTVALTYDGANIWVANGESDSVSKIRARDGVLLATYPSCGAWPNGLAFDGASIWVANGHSDTIAAKCVWCCYKKECP